MKDYHNKLLGISIELPEDWLVQELEERLFLAAGPAESTFDGYQSTLSYTLAEAESNDDEWFEELISDTEARQRLLYSEYSIVHQEHYELEGYRAFLRHCRWRLPGFEVYSAHLQGLIWPKKTDIWLIKGATLEPFEAEILPIMEAILRSTKII
jgi:hypothetical protein